MRARPLHALLGALVVMAAACGGSHETTDAAPPGADAPPATGQLGDACERNTDCEGGYCVEEIGGVGGVCTHACDQGCPAEWSCRDVKVGDTTASLCIPDAPQLCLPCATDAECGTNGACLALDGEGRCGTSCTTACPTGYTCAADPTGAHAGNYCQPVTGSCTCSAAMADATRACTNENVVGTCFGTQTCDPATGWSACTAATATAEACDGEDNDCDFLIDEDVGGGEACTNTVTGVGTCTGARTCGGAVGFICEGQIPAPEACNYADDDCDGSVDEDFPTVGNLCSPGVGACQRFGSIRCSADGTTAECSVTAGTAGAELCNQIDDDCDGPVDEDFPTLGTPCSAGLGVCMRYGTTVCSATGMTTMCSVTAGMPASSESCDYLDDDCDGVVDNGFRNPLTGVYDMTADCGACGNDCTAVYMGGHSTGACSTAGGAPHCVMVCDPDSYDLNGSSLDGCEFVLDPTSVYVSISDPAAADDGTCGLGPTGTGNHPCRTIAYGLQRATSLSRSNVRVADGAYDEAVTLVTGKNLYGGYRAGTWERHVATTSTVIQGVSTTGNHDRTVIAIGVTSATFDGFVVRGALNTKSEGNSYALYVSGCDATLVLSNNQIFAGRGGPGADGTPGTNGATAPDGTGSVNGSYNSFETDATPCGATNDRQFTNGAVFSCGADDVSGGNGGGNRCAPATDLTQFSAIDGFAGQPGDGAGGGAAGGTSQGGYDGQLDIQGTSQNCSLPDPHPMYGADGQAGQSGSNGGGVVGCASAAGTVVAGDWVNGTAASGNPGFNGGGGGGGAGGGGGSCVPGGNCVKDRLGAHGGGGGAGGCGGTGGGAGNSGGGVFGIFIVGGSAPTITGNTIQRGDGGTAGEGGIGGAGGHGGAGAPGGAAVSTLLCADKAGRGGDGGNGGNGSGGGGGCGGSSYGIFSSGVGSPGYCASNTVSGGSAGSAGAGGYSGGSPGGDGAPGVLGDCVSM